MYFSARTGQFGGFPVLFLAGELDFAMKTQLQDAMADFVLLGDCLMLDLEDVSFVDSASLGIFINLDADLVVRGGGLAIASLQPDVGRIFQTVGLDRLLAVFDTPREAGQYLSRICENSA